VAKTKSRPASTATVARDLATRVDLLAQAAQIGDRMAVKTNRLALEKWIDDNLAPADRARAKHRVKQEIALVLERVQTCACHLG
jgi:hypothetical protein